LRGKRRGEERSREERRRTREERSKGKERGRSTVESLAERAKHVELFKEDLFNGALKEAEEENQNFHNSRKGLEWNH
jgi:hypothetical protein